MSEDPPRASVDSGSTPIRTSSLLLTGMTAPDFTAPTNKGHTLAPDAFADRLAVVLVFLGGIDDSPGAEDLWSFDTVLGEFGARRVQLLAVASATPKALRDRAGDSSLTILADEDESIRTAFGMDATSAVVVNRHGLIAGVLNGDDVTPATVIEMLDELLAEHPDSVEANPGTSAASATRAAGDVQ